MDLEQIIYKITHLPYYLYLMTFDRKRNKSGLIKSEDERNFKTSKLGWSLFGYTPKNQRKVIEPFMIFDQGRLNVCVYCGSLSHKMDDEQVELDISDLISCAARKGYTTADGLSSVDAGFKVLKDYGCKEGKNPETLSDWETISTKPLNTVEAAKHKIASFWEVDTRDDRLKLLDEGRTLNTGLNWFTGFNQGGGFKSPWIISKAIGYLVGGHDVKIIGYDLNYQGKRVYIFVNSYGKYWGDNGKFYIEMDYFDKNNFGVYTTLDMPADLGSIVSKYDGQFVKGNTPAIYLIQKGVKKVFPNWATFLAYGGKFKGFVQLSGVESQALNNLVSGDQMDIKKSPAWSEIQDVTNLDDKNHELINTLLDLSKQQLGIR